mmetsp:Transcript_61431/g.180241  ORF Transcript_61431/g.180241 Transcript_61431/m.180241 type:complete len:93 (+) Transcript_61431:1870-2148(+)
MDPWDLTFVSLPLALLSASAMPSRVFAVAAREGESDCQTASSALEDPRRGERGSRGDRVPHGGAAGSELRLMLFPLPNASLVLPLPNASGDP